MFYRNDSRTSRSSAIEQNRAIRLGFSERNRGWSTGTAVEGKQKAGEQNENESLEPLRDGKTLKTARFAASRPSSRLSIGSMIEELKLPQR